MSNISSNGVDSENFTLQVKNFGPIESARVDLKPLTVFVGRSNTGKSYLATLIYALHEELGGFPKLPYSPGPDTIHNVISWEKQIEDFKELSTNLKNKLAEIPQNANLSDLPSIFTNTLFSSGVQNESIQKNIIKNTLKAFGEKNIYYFCRNNGKTDQLIIKFSYSEEGSKIWEAKIKENDFETFLQASLLQDVSIPGAVTSQIKSIFEEEKSEIELQYTLYGSIKRIMEILSYPRTQTPNCVYYVPAVRSGILQGHRFVTSAELDQSLYYRLEDSSVVGHLPKTSTDFIKNLLLIGKSLPELYYKRENQSKHFRSRMDSAADKIERLIFDEHIEGYTEFLEKYPEKFIRSRKINNRFGINQSSSMVSALIPIILFVRHLVQQYDLLILEEPEAHLHPEAQVEIARCLALLVRSGVRVIVITHSDWFLKCIQKLIIRGKLSKLRFDDSKDESNSYLHENEVGVWNFVKGARDKGAKVKRIEFQEDVGVEPQEIEDLALSLYNDVIRDRNHIARVVFNSKKRFTPRDIAARLSVSVYRIRQKLKQFDIKPVKGRRYFFDKREFDDLCKRLTDEFNLKIKI